MFLCGLILIATSGCGRSDQVIPSPTNAVSQDVTESVPALKKRLGEIAASGDGGSALMGIQESIEKNVTDPALKSSLLNEARQLNASTNPNTIKTIAKRMVEKL
jgi:hypothetical protein